jgi:hypothetical protein
MKIVRNNGEIVVKPAGLGFDPVDPAALYGGASVQEAAALFDRVLENRCTEEQKNVVLANTAVAIQVADPDKSFETAVQVARESLVEWTRAWPTSVVLLNSNKDDRYTDRHFRCGYSADHCDGQAPGSRCQTAKWCPH